MAADESPMTIASATTPADIPPDAWDLRPLSSAPGGVTGLVSNLEAVAQRLSARKDELRYFANLYRRSSQATKEGIQRGDFFLDSAWVERWVYAFGNTYLQPMERLERGETLGVPWQFVSDLSKDRSITPMRHLLLGVCVHLNFDLPRAFLQAVTDEEFQNPEVMARRKADFHKFDEILTGRVAEEDRLLQADEEPGDRPAIARLLTPFSQLGARKFIVELRGKVWRNAQLLSLARQTGPSALKERVRQLDGLTRAKMLEVLRPGPVLIRLALGGFGIRLPEP